MKNFLIKYSTGKTVLVLFILANSIYAIMVAVTIPKTAQFADGMKILDMMPGGYDFDYVYSLFNTLGEAGRNTYRNTQIPFDMVYPALFALSFSLLLAFFLKKLNRQNTWLIYVCILPFIGGIADYAENIDFVPSGSSTHASMNACTAFMSPPSPVQIFTFTPSLAPRRWCALRFCNDLGMAGGKTRMMVALFSSTGPLRVHCAFDWHNRS